MKARPIQGIENEFEMINIRAETSGEADLLERMWKEGVRVVSGGWWQLYICSPKLANLKAFYLSEEQQKLIHDALVQSHVKDRTLSSLLTDLVPSRE